jgi:hypothetical protein
MLMDVQKVTHEIRLRQWIGIIKECRGSGKTVKSWCAENGINEKSYFYWQKRVREAACQELTAYQEKAISPARNESGPVFMECRIPMNHRVGDAEVTVHLNGAVVEIRHGADSSVIESTLHALKTKC